jgi:hypothetical protein
MNNNIKQAYEKGFIEGYQKALADLLMDALHVEALLLNSARDRNK